MILDNDRVIKELESMEKQARAIKDDLIKIVWHMRGGISYEEAHQLNFKEKQLIAELIKDHMETTKKTGLPYF